LCTSHGVAANRFSARHGLVTRLCDHVALMQRDGEVTAVERFADELDLAQHRAQEMTEHAIASIRRRAEIGPGRQDCLDCGDRIPTDRLAKVPNACRCTPCQDHHERRVLKASTG
jgi:phage/conjugal plasmid C-4 type zinc finger TraR family protein